MKPFNSNPRFIKIMNSLLKQQAILAKFQKHCEDQKEKPSIIKTVVSFIKRIKLFSSKKT
jgi:phosphoketolase